MKVIILVSWLVAIFSFKSFSQSNENLNPFIGKWKRCFHPELYTETNCEGEWTFEFFEDGTYKENTAFIANYIQYEFVSGTWSFSNGTLTIHEDATRIGESWSTSYNLTELRDDLFYERKLEGVKRKETIYVFTYFQKVVGSN